MSRVCNTKYLNKCKSLVRLGRKKCLPFLIKRFEFICIPFSFHITHVFDCQLLFCLCYSVTYVLSAPFEQERDTDPETSDVTLMAASLEAPTFKEPVKAEVYNTRTLVLYYLLTLSHQLQNKLRIFVVVAYSFLSAHLLTEIEHCRISAFFF